MQDGAAEQQATHEQAAGLSEAADPEVHSACEKGSNAVWFRIAIRVR